MSQDFFGYPTRTLANEHIRLDYLTTAGPRIVRLSLAGSDDNLLAEVADIKIPTPYGDFNIFGGHRLWHSPEAFPRSYLPDNDAPEIDRSAGRRAPDPGGRAGKRHPQEHRAAAGARPSRAHAHPPPGKPGRVAGRAGLLGVDADAPGRLGGLPADAGQAG